MENRDITAAGIELEKNHVEEIDKACSSNDAVDYDDNTQDWTDEEERRIVYVNLFNSFQQHLTSPDAESISDSFQSWGRCMPCRSSIEPISAWRLSRVWIMT